MRSWIRMRRAARVSGISGIFSRVYWGSMWGICFLFGIVCQSYLQCDANEEAVNDSSMDLALVTGSTMAFYN